MENKRTVTTGIGIGNVLAAILSYTAWHSIPWAIFHCMFGWMYVIYYAVKYLI